MWATTRPPCRPTGARCRRRWPCAPGRCSCSRCMARRCSTCSRGLTPTAAAADACATTAPGLACTIMVADCLPVLFTDRQGRRVAAAHAGWRGLAGGRAACWKRFSRSFRLKRWHRLRLQLSKVKRMHRLHRGRRSRPVLRPTRWHGSARASARRLSRWAPRCAPPSVRTTARRRSCFRPQAARQVAGRSGRRWRASAWPPSASARSTATTAAPPGARWPTRHGSFRTGATARRRQRALRRLHLARLRPQLRPACAAAARSATSRAWMARRRPGVPRMYTTMRQRQQAIQHKGDRWRRAAMPVVLVASATAIMRVT